MADGPEIVGKTDQEVQEALRREELRAEGNDAPEPDEDDTLEVDTAFVVFIQNGEAFGIASVGDLEVQMGEKTVSIKPLGEATYSDMWRACTEVAKDINVQETAKVTVGLHMQQMQAQMQALQNSQLAQRLGQAGGGGGPQGLQIPGR